MKQLINNTCQLKGVYNQGCLVWQVCLFILVITSKWNPCLSVCMCFVSLKKLIYILIYLQCTCWHHEVEWLGQLFWRMMTMIRILRDFKPILDLNLYGEHSLWKEIQGQKLTSTYLPGRLLHEYIQSLNPAIINQLQVLY